MKAYVSAPGGATLTEVAAPLVGAGQVLVRVKAAGLNRADLMMRQGSGHGFSIPEGVVLGTEWSGEIVEVGSGVSRLQPGDRVMGTGRGAFGEYRVADYGQLFPIPGSLSFEEAATLPVALTTMHNAVVSVGRVQAGQTVLVQGASSGVGLMAMQIARLKGARLVIGSSTDAARRRQLPDHGADIAIDSRDSGWVQQVLDATDGEGVDLVIDQVSGKVAAQNLAATRIAGRIVNVGRLGGAQAVFDFDLHAARQIDYVGVTFRSRTIEQIRQIFVDVRSDIWPAVESRTLRLPIDQTFAFVDIERAFARMEANQHLGKLILTLD